MAQNKRDLAGSVDVVVAARGGGKNGIGRASSSIPRLTGRGRCVEEELAADGMQGIHRQMRGTMGKDKE